MATVTDTAQSKSSMDSTFPVLLPKEDALFLSNKSFETYIHNLLSEEPNEDHASTVPEAELAKMDIYSTTEDSFTMISEPAGQDTILDAAHNRGLTNARILENIQSPNNCLTSDEADKPGSNFMHALLDDPIDKDSPDNVHLQNKMLTENSGIAYRSTNSYLLDLFSELEKTVSGPRLRELLKSAWKEDSLASLKIVWNARSIHLGKSDKDTFYRSLGWIRMEHPKTVIKNLPWMFRSVIEKRVKKEEEDSAVMVEKTRPTAAEAESAGNPFEGMYDVVHGVSHGYWKDLLNLLVLTVNGSLDVLKDPRTILNARNGERSKERSIAGTALGKRKQHFHDRSGGRSKGRKGISQETQDIMAIKKSEKKPPHEKIKEAFERNARHKREAKEKQHQLEAARHANALKKLGEPFYRAMHLTIARLFAEQLHKDLKLLESGKRKDLDEISLASKWAPSLEGFHDKHTFIASSIAEILYSKLSKEEIVDDRELFLKRAREWYRHFVISPLRKALQVVERDVSAQTFENIQYNRVPSLAMDRYKDLFVRKDYDRFEAYIGDVAQGKTRISGAVLMPATLVKQAREVVSKYGLNAGKVSNNAQNLLAQKNVEIQTKVLDGQWATLVQRIKDNGKLESSIAVCDVSGSMYSPYFPDRTCPLDTSIGLALLLSEITEPPFGGAFISFSEKPQVIDVSVGGFTQKFKTLMDSPMGFNTNFIAVFEDLILPLAIKHKLKRKDMVKQVFVFSDMQFDEAQEDRGDAYTWKAASKRISGHNEKRSSKETAYERIKCKYQTAGYDLPRLIFWNLAGGRAGCTGYGDPVAPKPITQEVEGTALVSGYSQGMMKMFLDEGQFGAEAGDEDEFVEKDGEGGVVEITKKEKSEADPMAVMWKAIGHKAYDMLEVVD